MKYFTMKKIKGGAIHMRRLLCLILMAALILTAACATTQSGSTIDPTIEPTVEPTKEPLTADKLARIADVNYTDPKNVILMIGDGMGFNHIESALEVAGSAFGDSFAMSYLSNQGKSNAATLDNVHDSAAGGTALATGHKTNLYYVGVNYKKEPIKNLVELAQEKGKMTGVITTADLTDATPADFTAHVSDRYAFKADIIKSQIMGGPDILLGGGLKAYESLIDDEMTTKLNDGSVTWCKSWEDLLKVESGRVIGTFETDWDTADAITAAKVLWEEDEYHLVDPAQTPTLSQMTEYSLEKLSSGDNGFFLMIEGAEIDDMSHKSNMIGMSQHLKEFDRCVALVMEFILDNPDTILIVTADHETGEILKNKQAQTVINTHKNEYHQKSVIENLAALAEARLNAGLEAEPEYTYAFSTIAHSGNLVPIFAVGKGTEIFNGETVKQYEIGKFLGNALGDPEFGSSAKNGR